MDFRDTALNRLLAELALKILAGACLPGPRVKPLAGGGGARSHDGCLAVVALPPPSTR
jgi:hypothetical protein